jgi:flagellar hook-length control protein FliK
MITLKGHSDQLQPSSELACAARQENRPNRKASLAPESGFDVLFSSLAAAPQMNPALQQRPEPSENTVYEPCNAPDDPISASKAPARNSDSRDALQEKQAPTAQTDAARNETAPAQNDQPSQTEMQNTGSANAPADSTQTAENPAAGIAQAVQAGMQGNAGLRASGAAQPTLEIAPALINEAVLAQSAVQAQPTQATTPAVPDTPNVEPKGLADVVSGKQSPALQPDPVRDLKSAPFAKDATALLSVTIENSPETKSTSTPVAAPVPTQPVEPKNTNQISEARNEAAFKELISAIKVAVTAGPASQDTSSFTPGFGENTGSAPELHIGLPAQGDNSFSLLLGRDTTQIVPPAGVGEAAPVRTGQRTESIAPSVRSLDALDTMVSKASISRDGNHLAITLKPEGLGKLDINISLEKGLLNAQIQVSDPSVKHLIENNLQQIVNTLMHEGLNVSGFSVSLRQGAPEDGSNSGLNGFPRQPEKEFVGSVIDRPYEQNSMISIFV